MSAETIRPVVAKAGRDRAQKPVGGAKLSKLGAEKLTPEEGALSQLDKFKQAAREIGTDDDPERFKERVRKVGRAKGADTMPSPPGSPKPQK